MSAVEKVAVKRLATYMVEKEHWTVRHAVRWSIIRMRHGLVPVGRP